jgi:hypothetical protein
VKVLLPLLLDLAASGCSYFRERGEDFLDVWRGDLHVFALPGGWVHAGPLAHGGLGSTRFPVHGGPVPGIGHIYNRYPADEAACTDAYGLFFHARQEDADPSRKHLCFVVLPGLIHVGEQDRPWIHLFDLEAGVGLLFLGIDVGFSPGQFFDFLLGWFGLDLAGDDLPEARTRSNGLPRPAPPEPPLLIGGFRRGDCVELVAAHEDLAAGVRGHVHGIQGDRLIVDFPPGVSYAVPPSSLRRR